MNNQNHVLEETTFSKELTLENIKLKESKFCLLTNKTELEEKISNLETNSVLREERLQELTLENKGLKKRLRELTLKNKGLDENIKKKEEEYYELQGGSQGAWFQINGERL